MNHLSVNLLLSFGARCAVLVLSTCSSMYFNGSSVGGDEGKAGSWLAANSSRSKTAENSKQSKPVASDLVASKKVSPDLKPCFLLMVHAHLPWQ